MNDGYTNDRIRPHRRGLRSVERFDRTLARRYTARAGVHRRKALHPSVGSRRVVRQGTVLCLFISCFNHFSGYPCQPTSLTCHGAVLRVAKKKAKLAKIMILRLIRQLQFPVSARRHTDAIGLSSRQMGEKNSKSGVTPYK